MSFNYLTGQTAAAAPDHVQAWFDLFSDWIVNTVGWAIFSGAGTKDMVIGSSGETGDYDQLYVRFYEHAVLGIIVAEVQNDVPGTQVTTRLTLLRTNSAQFTYYMIADLDAIFVAFDNNIAQNTWTYVGCVMPFCLLPPDETYIMVAVNTIDTAAVLRDSTGAWDVDIAVQANAASIVMHRSPLGAGGYPLFGLVAGVGRSLVGQLKFISGETDLGQLAHDDTLDNYSNDDNYQSRVFLDIGGAQFAFRTGGDEPVGRALPTSYRYQTGISDGITGVSAGYDTFIANTVSAFLVSLGWQDLGSPGLHTFSRLFYSTGELGTDDIYIIVAFQGGTGFYMYVQNDAVGTQRTGGAWNTHDNGAFPMIYHMAGDRDCFVWTAENDTGYSPVYWAGKMIPGDRLIPTADYALGVWCSEAGHYRVLRSLTGAWTPVADLIDEFAVNCPGVDTTPSGIDGLTNMLFPYGLSSRVGLARYFQGTLKYVWGGDGSGMIRGDTIPIAGQTYRTFRHLATPTAWALRI